MSQRRPGVPRAKGGFDVLTSDRQWVYATRRQALDIQEGFDVAEGMPKRSVPLNAGKHAPIEASFSPGAEGWTEHFVSIDAEISGTRYAIQRTRQARKHEGKVVRVRGSDIQLPDNASAESRGPGWDSVAPASVPGK